MTLLITMDFDQIVNNRYLKLSCSGQDDAVCISGTARSKSGLESVSSKRSLFRERKDIEGNSSTDGNVESALALPTTRDQE